MHQLRQGVLVEDLSQANHCFSELLRFDPDIDTDDIARTYDYLAQDTRQQLIDSIQLLITREKPRDRLRVVKI